VVERYVREALIGGDQQVVAELVDSDEIPDLTAQFNAAFTDRAVNMLGPIFASADGGHVACYANVHLRQVAPFLHVNAVGSEADIDIVAIYQVDDGKITHVWVEWDMAGLIAAGVA
jgi:predicted ester cyclase